VKRRLSGARIAAVALPIAAAWAPLGACSGPSAAVDRGGACYLATDCAPGLVCVPQKNGTRICTDDLTGLGAPPPEGGAGDSGDAGDATEETPIEPPDTGPPDTGPPDTGPPDTGPPPGDAGDEG
jgi:hypothetical protein